MKLLRAVAGPLILIALASPTLGRGEGNEFALRNVFLHPTCKLLAALSKDELTFLLSINSTRAGSIERYFFARLQWCIEPTAAKDQAATAAWQVLLKETNESPAAEEADLEANIDMLRAWLEEVDQMQFSEKSNSREM